MVKGECNCGSISFEITTELTDVYVCHCSICRRSTGSAGIAVTVVHSTQFNWLTGTDKIRTWSKPGHDWETSFCTTCGSPLPGVNDANRMYVPVSLLTTGTDNLRVIQHMFVGSKASWEVIGDSGQQHQEHIGK